MNKVNASSIDEKRVSYAVTHRRIKDAITQIMEAGGAITVKNVAKHANICTATAYKHGCPDMIRDALK